MVAGQPGLRDEPAVEPDRAEPLVVEVVRQAVAGQLRRAPRAARSPPGTVRSRRTTAKRLPRNCAGPVGMGQPAQRLQVEARLVQRPVGPSRIVRYWTVDGVPVLQPAVADPPPGEVPAPADRLDRLERPQPALGQPVEDEPAPVAPRDDGQLLDPEILGQALELHRPRRGGLEADLPARRPAPRPGRRVPVLHATTAGSTRRVPGAGLKEPLSRPDGRLSDGAGGTRDARRSEHRPRLRQVVTVRGSFEYLFKAALICSTSFCR